jgi:hypothetical protein
MAASRIARAAIFANRETENQRAGLKAAAT